MKVFELPDIVATNCVRKGIKNLEMSLLNTNETSTIYKQRNNERLCDCIYTFARIPLHLQVMVFQKTDVYFGKGFCCQQCWHSSFVAGIKCKC